MQTTSDSRLYPIQNEPAYFHTGRLHNGTQILVGIQFPDIALVEFDAPGNYLRIVTRAIPKQFFTVIKGLYHADDDILQALIQNWQDEIGFVAGTIFVKPFFLPDRWIGIRELPDYYQGFLDRPEDFEEEEGREAQEIIRQWRERGDFVLYWAEDYYMSAEGEVIGS